MKKIILASMSPRRKEILKKFKIKYTAVNHKADEDAIQKSIKSKNPYTIATTIAYEKAKSVVSDYKAGIILGSDTIVVLGGKIIGKPKSKKDAVRILTMLSGSIHKVVTGISFIDAASGKSVTTYDESKIFFKKMPLDKIKEYIENNDVMDKAGSYAIQDGADPFIRKTEGSYYNIVGLPIEKVIKVMKMWDRL